MKKILKKLTATIVLSGLMVCMTACGKTDEVKEDLYTYLTEMTQIQESQKAAINEYNTYVSSPEADSQQLLTALNDSVIPKYEEYIVQINTVTPATEEVQNLKSSCQAAANKQLEALKKVAEAVEACDTNMLNEADTLISEAGQLFNEYEAQIETLAAEHEITLIQQDSNATQEDSASEDVVAE